MRAKYWLLIIVLLAMSVVPVMAQDAPWYVYLYNGKDLTRVYLDGAQETYNLGLPENVFLSSREMAFSADGSRVTYCAITYPGGVDNPSGTLVVRDIAAQSNLLEVDLGNPIACRTGQDAFSSDETRLAVGIINYIVGNPEADTSLPAWQLLVVDTTTGDIIAEVNDQSPTFANPAAQGATMPFVRGFESNQVIFAPVPYFTEGFPETAYRWHLDTGNIEVESGEQWRQYIVDTLAATGEQVWLTADPNLPAIPSMGIGPTFNVVRIADNSGQTQTILHVPDFALGDVQFINNGQQLAVMMMTPFDESQPSAPIQYRWVALDRTGGVTDLVTDTIFTNLDGAPDGYVRLTSDLSDEANTSFRLEYTANGRTTELWSSTMPRSDHYAAWELAWAAPLQAAEGLRPFPTI